MKAALALVCLSGCALLTRNHPPKIRYFTAEPAPAATASAPTPLELRLARVEAASYIQDRIAFRDSSAEVGYYGELRWAEPPEATLERALSQALFQARGLHELLTGGPTLAVTLDAFEELRAPHRAHVVVTWRLRDDRAIVVQKTLTVEKPVDGADPRALARAMADAYREVVQSIVDAVLPALANAQASGST
jgi:ABC-type uncharacterized transport system auxiliary subunit